MFRGLKKYIDRGGGPALGGIAMRQYELLMIAVSLSMDAFRSEEHTSELQSPY